MTMTTKQLTRITMILRDTHEAGGLTFQGAEITPTNPYDRVHALNMAAGEVPLEILDDCLTLKSEWGSDDDYSEHNFVAIVGPDAELLANWEVQ